MWFASALLSGEQTVVSTSYGSTKPWQSAFVTLSITRILLDLHSVILRCSYEQTDSRTDRHAQRVDRCPKQKFTLTPPMFQ